MKAKKNNNILAIIPARGGSKGIKNKNLAQIGKTNLIARAIQICKKSSKIDKIIVSTDSEAIAREAIKESGKDILLATSLPPLETSYRADLVLDKSMLEDQYAEMVGIIEGKTDIIITMSIISRKGYNF